MKIYKDIDELMSDNLKEKEVTFICHYLGILEKEKLDYTEIVKILNVKKNTAYTYKVSVKKTLTKPECCMFFYMYPKELLEFCFDTKNYNEVFEKIFYAYSFYRNPFFQNFTRQISWEHNLEGRELHEKMDSIESRLNELAGVLQGSQLYRFLADIERMSKMVHKEAYNVQQVTSSISKHILSLYKKTPPQAIKEQMDEMAVLLEKANNLIINLNDSMDVISLVPHTHK